MISQASSSVIGRCLRVTVSIVTQVYSQSHTGGLDSSQPKLNLNSTVTISRNRSRVPSAWKALNEDDSTEHVV